MRTATNNSRHARRTKGIREFITPELQGLAGCVENSARRYKGPEERERVEKKVEAVLGQIRAWGNLRLMREDCQRAERELRTTLEKQLRSLERLGLDSEAVREQMASYQ